MAENMSPNIRRFFIGYFIGVTSFYTIYNYNDGKIIINLESILFSNMFVTLYPWPIQNTECEPSYNLLEFYTFRYLKRRLLRPSKF